ncbi:hypothetical protein [Flammeovirga sp. SJP92]|uniref:hypothetical protein n=1 Tax=Flammeovirga sp. SJP92 TaxID=1775430 RepID=UPI000786A27F|nr:hypothetical protein [Flammeovirga sp. SJP92]KXX68731.1 hypothetical protein AVL50_18845 [Flammeovirga sp. SJP92]
MRKYFVLILILFSSFIVNAQERDFSEETIKELKEDPDYTYVLPQYQISTWDYITDWLSDIFSELFGENFVLKSSHIEILIWFTIVGLVFWAVYLILDANHIIIFKSDKKIKQQGLKTIYSTNESIIPLSTQLEEAIKANNNHEIVRLYYLLAIEKLDQKGIINLHKIEHHNDILFQLKTDLIKKPFHSIGLYFQYCWYGEFEANDTISEQLKTMYYDFETAVDQYEKV